MKIITRPVTTQQRNQIVDITDLVQQIVSEARIDEGFVIVYVPHTTAAVTINENYDPDVKHDMLKKLETLAPRHETYYRHGEGNSDSHVKAALVGNSATVLLEAGRLILGQWQGIYFCEFDGPRQRKVMVKAIKA